MIKSCIHPYDMSGKFSNMFRACMAELFGTLVLVTAATSIKKNEMAGPLALLFSIWLAGPVSGGHLNPIVSFLMLLRRKIGFFIFIFYVLAQIIGATLGCIVGKSLLVMRDNRAGMTLLQPDCNVAQAFWSETLFAFFFALVVLSATNDARSPSSSFYCGNPALTPFLIGFATCLVGAIAGDLAGGSVNPARSLGPALANQHFDDQWIYLVAPFVGATFAIITYTLLLDETMSLRRIKEYFGLIPNRKEQKDEEFDEDKL